MSYYTSKNLLCYNKFVLQIWNKKIYRTLLNTHKCFNPNVSWAQTHFDPFANMIITNTAFTIQLVIVSAKETYVYSETFTQWGKLTSEGIVNILFRINKKFRYFPWTKMTEFQTCPVTNYNITHLGVMNVWKKETLMQCENYAIS